MGLLIRSISLRTLIGAKERGSLPRQMPGVSALPLYLCLDAERHLAGQKDATRGFDLDVVDYLGHPLAVLVGREVTPAGERLELERVPTALPDKPAPAVDTTGDGGDGAADTTDTSGGSGTGGEDLL